jgi:anti-sigma factor RsiW
MRKHIKSKDLSAYLDGESVNVSVVESHLDGCVSCTEELASLKTLSQRMHELPEPEIHPAFTTRVLAAIAEEETTRDRSGVLRWVFGLAPVAVAAALFLTISLNAKVQFPDSTGSVSVQPNEVAKILAQDEEALFDELSAHFAQNDSSDSIVAAGYQATAPESAMKDTTLLTLALNDSKVRSHVDQQWSGSKDVRTTIRHLNVEESSLFKQMLMVHAQEALLGEASFEG